MTREPFNLTSHGMALFIAIAGVFTVIAALTSSHFANEEGGIPSDEERQRFRATPSRRAVAVAIGLVEIVVGLLWFTRS